MTTDPQYFLDKCVASDTYGFLKKSESNWDSHRPLIWLGLNLTNRLVVELGSGEGSTPYFRKYCPDNQRPFISFDSNKEWSEKMSVEHIPDWDQYEDWHLSGGLLFVDMAPGEYRWKAIQKLYEKFDIIVFHDSEIGGAGNYMYHKIYPLFKYQLHYNRHGGGAGASMVSNKIDVSKFKGLKLGQFQFDNE